MSYDCLCDDGAHFTHSFVYLSRKRVSNSPRPHLFDAASCPLVSFRCPPPPPPASLNLLSQAPTLTLTLNPELDVTLFAVPMPLWE